MSVHDDVKADYKTAGDYLTLHGDYVHQMSKILGDKQVSELSLNSPYWNIQRKLNYLFALHHDGTL